MDRECVKVGLVALNQNLPADPRSKVCWDFSLDNMKKCAECTQLFLDILGVVAMVDGDKLQSKQPANYLEQNRDYNGWTHDVNRNVVLVWDTFGKTVDCVVNAPGSFHDSTSSWWGGIYDHFENLPDGCKCCCDSAQFYTKGKLDGKLVKTKEEFKEGLIRSSYDQSLTHLRQCSEWGNNTWIGGFRRLRTPLPTDNQRRGLIMWSSIYLHNWRTETMERNQILTCFEHINEEEVELDD